MNTEQINQQLQAAFSDGVYLNITFHTGWMGSEKIPEAEAKERGLDVEIERGIRSLLLPEDYEHYNDLTNLKREVEKRFKSNKGRNWKADTIYSGIADLDLLPSAKISEAYQWLTEKREDVNQLAEVWANCISEKEKKFAEKYPGKYNSSKYPSKAEVKSRIIFDFSVHNVSLPNKKTLGEDIYEQESKKVVETYRKAADLISGVFVKEMMDVLVKMKDGCTNDSKRLDSRVIEKAKSLCDKFNGSFKSYIHYKDVEKMVKDLEEFLEDDDPKELAALVRGDDNLKGLVGGMVTDIMKDLKNSKDKEVKRFIDF